MRFLLFSLRQTKQLSDITRGKMHNSESPESRLVHYQTLICAQNKLRCHAESAQISARLRQLGEEAHGLYMRECQRTMSKMC
jgi:hypothetical protein